MKLFLFVALWLGLLAGPALAIDATTAPPTAGPTMAPTAAPADLTGIGARPDAATEPPLELGRGGMDIPILPYLIQLVVVTGVVGGLGYLAVNFLKDKVPSMGLGLASGKQIKVIDKVTIDPKRMVFMINVGNRYFLMAATDETVTTVAELDKADLGGEFAQLLQQERDRGEAV